MALPPADLDPVRPKSCPLGFPFLTCFRTQTSLDSHIYGANFLNHVRVTDSWYPFTVHARLTEGEKS
jgi:hypothetical protein